MLTDMSAKRRTPDQKKRLAEFKARMDAHLAAMPDSERQRLKEFREIFTPARERAFDEHWDVFATRAEQLYGVEFFNEYVSGDAETRKQIGRRIRDARKQLGMKTQKELADAARVNVETISRMENGANVEIETLSKVRSALFISIDHPAEILLRRDRRWFLETLDRLTESALISESLKEATPPKKDDDRDLTRHAGTGASTHLPTEGEPDVPATARRIADLERLVADYETRLREMQDVASRLVKLAALGSAEERAASRAERTRGRGDRKTG